MGIPSVPGAYSPVPELVIMVGISKLYCGTIESSDVLRYGRKSSSLPSHMLQFSSDKRPVVILNITRRCNLRCVHCYAGSDENAGAGELTAAQWKKVLDDLSSYGCPVVLFSGGEPLMHPALAELARHAVSRGMRAVISSNGTLITPEKAEHLKSIGLSYIGISIDGDRPVHDLFRGAPGAFDRALRGIRNTRDAGIKTGIRFTITGRNVQDIPTIMDLMERENIPRICFYHLVAAGRGGGLVQESLAPGATREVVDRIIDRTADMHRRGYPVEVLTVDNHCDGPYLYLRLVKENPARAEEVMRLLLFNGGNSSGVGVAAINWDGDVYPDQFWRSRVLGNVLARPFEEIWTDTGNEFLMRLKEKKKRVTGRCSQCRFLDICGGNFRARAEAATGDPWAPDPACYLTGEEIGIG